MDWLNTSIGPLKDLITFLNKKSVTNDVHKRQLLRGIAKQPERF